MLTYSTGASLEFLSDSSGHKCDFSINVSYLEVTCCICFGHGSADNPSPVAAAGYQRRTGALSFYCLGVTPGSGVGFVYQLLGLHGDRWGRGSGGHLQR